MMQFVMAQNEVMNPLNAKKGEILMKKIDMHKYQKGTKGDNSRWYNYGLTMDTINGGGGKLLGNNLFPDSTVIIKYSDGQGGYTYGGPWIHNIGEVLDVTSDNFNNSSIYTNGELFLTKADTFKLDSVQIPVYYSRKINDDNIIDTLQVEIAVNNSLSKVYFANSAINTNLSSDTVFLYNIPYTYTKNTMNLSAKKTYKIPLTPEFFADSIPGTAGMQIINFSTSDLNYVKPGKYVALSYKFVPGYTWNINQDSLSNLNSLFFLSMKESDTQFPLYTKRDYNISYIIPQDVKYNVAGGWNGCFVPSFAYMGGATPSYGYQHHSIYYRVSRYGNVSVPEMNGNANFIGNAFPSPVNQGENINISVDIATADAHAAIILHNSIGQIISEYSLNGITGKHNTCINTNGMQSGIYFYTLKSSNGNVTKSFIVQ